MRRYKVMALGAVAACGFAPSEAGEVCDRYGDGYDIADLGWTVPVLEAHPALGRLSTGKGEHDPEVVMGGMAFMAASLGTGDELEALQWLACDADPEADETLPIFPTTDAEAEAVAAQAAEALAMLERMEAAP